MFPWRVAAASVFWSTAVCAVKHLQISSVAGVLKRPNEASRGAFPGDDLLMLPQDLPPSVEEAGHLPVGRGDMGSKVKVAHNGSEADVGDGGGGAWPQACLAPARPLQRALDGLMTCTMGKWQKHRCEKRAEAVREALVTFTEAAEKIQCAGPSDDELLAMAKYELGMFVALASELMDRIANAEARGDHRAADQDTKMLQQIHKITRQLSEVWDHAQRVAKVKARVGDKAQYQHTMSPAQATKLLRQLSSFSSAALLIMLRPDSPAILRRAMMSAVRSLADAVESADDELQRDAERAVNELVALTTQELPPAAAAA
mmetsp:Transcript_90124/g.176456  ORF Transcript_90124/g.176456 Transcript_90124/m.176456 type:complete len:316 (-) Transcript_90124:31-978(-)